MKTIGIVATVAIAFLCAPAHASIITYMTPSGTTAGGQGVSAQAEFAFSADQLTVTLSNFQVNPKSVVQNLSGLFFTVSTGQTVATLFSSSGVSRTVAGNGTYSDGGAVSTGWALTGGIGGAYQLNVLGTAVGPAHTIIGRPNSLDVYSAANSSIAGNGPHNPFLGETATFTLSIPGLTEASGIGPVTFSFGTAGNNLVGGVTSTPVPEPATVSLLFLGGALLLRRKPKRLPASA